MFLKIYQLTCIYFSITLETVLPYFLSSFVHISESFLVSGCCLFWDKKEHTLHRGVCSPGARGTRARCEWGRLWPVLKAGAFPSSVQSQSVELCATRTEACSRAASPRLHFPQIRHGVHHLPLSAAPAL